MKKLLLGLAVIGLASFIPVTIGLTEAERNTATKFLAETETGVLEAVAGLSEAQLAFKPAPDKWSVEECMKHIAATETGLWQMTEGNIKQAANPEKRTEIKWSDDDVMKNIENRTNKVKTFPPFEPQNTGLKTLADAVSSFKENRAKLIEYVKTTDQDLRNHVATLPVGILIATRCCYLLVHTATATCNRSTK